MACCGTWAPRSRNRANPRRLTAPHCHSSRKSGRSRIATDSKSAAIRRAVNCEPAYCVPLPDAEPELVSLLVLGEVLGGVVSADDVDGALGDIDEVLDGVEGVLAGVELLLVLSELLGALEGDEADEPCTPSADKVCVSRLAVVV